MNGNVKLFLEYDGHTFFDGILSALEGVAPVYLSVNRKSQTDEGMRKRYAAPGLPMIVDELDEIGPMGGLLSAMHQIREEALVAVASDMPFLSALTIGKLLEAYRRNPVYTMAETAEGKQPLLAVYPKTMLPTLERMVSEGNYRLHAISKYVEHQLVRLSDEDCSAMNINTPEEYKKYVGN